MWKKQEAIKVKWMQKKMAENILQGKCVRPFWAGDLWKGAWVKLKLRKEEWLIIQEEHIIDIKGYKQKGVGTRMYKKRNKR
jgi:hypothetical protein